MVTARLPSLPRRFVIYQGESRVAYVEGGGGSVDGTGLGLI